jgi:hypothetical protein
MAGSVLAFQLVGERSAYDYIPLVVVVAEDVRRLSVAVARETAVKCVHKELTWASFGRLTDTISHLQDYFTPLSNHHVSRAR